jgi:hypothetical protein
MEAWLPVRIDPDLVTALQCTDGPVRVSVRAAVRQPVLEAALREAAAAVDAVPSTAGVRWRHVDPWVGELVLQLDQEDGRAAAVVDAIVFGLGQAGVRDADLLAVGGAARPATATAAAPAPQGVGRSRVLNGLAEAVASAYDRAGDPVGARRAREAAAGAPGGAAGDDGFDELEDQRRRAVLNLVLRTWLPMELEAAGAAGEAAALRALPNPTTDASAVLEAVGRSVLAAVDRLESTPRAAILDLESAYAVGRDLHDVTWGCAGEQGRAGEALVEAARSKRPAQPGQVLWTAASTGAVQRLLPLVETFGPDALERWRRMAREERTLHALVIKVMGASSTPERLRAVDGVVGGAVTAGPPPARAALEAGLARLPSVAWSLAVCTGWEAAGDRCRHVVARRGAEGRTALTARDGATAAVMAHVATLVEPAAELLHQLAGQAVL